MLPLIFLVFSIIRTEDELNVEHQNVANFPIGWFCVVWVWTRLKPVPVCGFVTTALPGFLENVRSPYTFFNKCDHSQYLCSAGDQFPLCRNFFFQMSHPIFYKMWMKLAFGNKNYWGKEGSVIRHTSFLQETRVKNRGEQHWYSGVYTYEGRVHSCPAVVGRSFYCESHPHVLGIFVIYGLDSNDVAATSCLPQHRAFWGAVRVVFWRFGIVYSLSPWEQLVGVWSLQGMHLRSWYFPVSQGGRQQPCFMWFCDYQNWLAGSWRCCKFCHYPKVASAYASARACLSGSLRNL